MATLAEIMDRKAAGTTLGDILDGRGDFTAAPREATAVLPVLRRPERQRRATGLERVLDALATSTYLEAGLVGQAQRREPLSLRRALAARETFGDVLARAAPAGVAQLGPAGMGMVSPRIPGLAVDIALAPETYLSGGLTVPGRLARAARLAEEFARLSGEAPRMARAAEQVAKAGRLGATAAQRQRLGQEALVTFAGRRVPLPGPVERAALTGLERTAAVGKRLAAPFRVAGEIADPIQREAFLAQKASLEGARRLAERKATEELRPVAQEIGRVSSRYRLPPADLRRAMADAVEVSGRTGRDVAQVMDEMSRRFGGAAEELQPRLRSMVARVNAINSSWLAATREAGIPIGEVVGDLGYMARRMTREARSEIEKFGPKEFRGMGREITEKHRAMTERSFPPGFTTTGINDMWQRGELSLNGYRKTKTLLFADDPLVAAVVRAGEGAKAVAAANMIRAWAREHGKLLPDLSETVLAGAPRGTAERILQSARKRYIQAGLHEVTTDIRGLESVWLPADLAGEFRRYRDAIVEPGAFLRAYDRGLKIWKRYTLGLFPVYHTRNELSDLFNAVALGGLDPAWLGPASRVLASNSRLGRFLPGVTPMQPIRLGADRYTYGELLDLGERLNVTNSGLVGEVADNLGTLREAPQALGERLLAPLEDNPALRLAQQVGTFRENSTRMAMLMDGMARGLPPEAAALRAKRYLFNYDELTDFERNVLRRFLPFYAWTRFNVPLQLEHVVRKPGVAAGVQKVREEVAGAEPLGMPGAPLATFLERGLPLRAGRSAQGFPQFARLEGTLPLADVQAVLGVTEGQPARRLLDLLTPAVSAPIETAFNIDLFTGRPLDPLFPSGVEAPATLLESITRGSQAPILGRVPFPARLRPALETSRLLTEAERVLGTRPSAEKPSLSQRVLNVLIGRTYAQDPETAARFEGVRQRKRYLDLRAQLFRAQRRGDTANVEQTVKLMEKMIEESRAAQ